MGSISLGLSATYLPPNSCIPNRAKTTMKRKRRKSRLIIDFMELISETTKFLRDAQYLEDRNITVLLTIGKCRTKGTGICGNKCNS